VSHVKKHKTAYLVGTLVVVTNGFTFLVMRQIGAQTISMSPVFNNVPIFNNDNSSLVNFGGHTTKFVKRLSDGKMWEKVTEAADEAGCGLPKMSRHLNGHSPHVYEEVYKIVGVGTTG
jgi:hypothetical protein